MDDKVRALAEIAREYGYDLQMVPTHPECVGVVGLVKLYSEEFESKEPRRKAKVCLSCIAEFRDLLITRAAGLVDLLDLAHEALHPDEEETKDGD